MQRHGVKPQATMEKSGDTRDSSVAIYGNYYRIRRGMEHVDFQRMYYLFRTYLQAAGNWLAAECGIRVGVAAIGKTALAGAGPGVAFCGRGLFDCADRGIESAAVEAAAGMGGGSIPPGLLTAPGPVS